MATKYLRNTQASQNGMSTEDFLRQYVFTEKNKSKRKSSSSDSPMSTEDYLKYEVFTDDDTNTTKDALYRPNLDKLGEKPEEALLENNAGFAEYDMDEIRINNDKGTFDIYKEGELKKSYPVTSGVPGETDRTKKYAGPTPRGTYYIDPEEARERDFFRRIKDYIYDTDWGRARVPLHPEEGTETYGRDNFFIHGGTRPGSGGCQDIGNADEEFFKVLEKNKKKGSDVIKVVIE